MAENGYRVGSFEFSSRLFVGTGKYDSFGLMKECLEASDTQVVTVAIRRDVLTPDGETKAESILDHLDMQRYTILPNTAGCFTAKDAIRSARLSRELLDGLGNAGANWVKLEVLADKKTLQHAVGAQLHGNGHIGSRPHTRVHDDRVVWIAILQVFEA